MTLLLSERFRCVIVVAVIVLVGRSMLLSLNAACPPPPTANSYSIMSGSGRTADDELSEFGVAIVGEVDLKLFEKFRLGSLDIMKRLGRQSELEWNSDCDTVVRDFETMSEKGQRGAYYTDGMIET